MKEEIKNFFQEHPVTDFYEEGYKKGYQDAINKACKWFEENLGLKHQTFIGLQGEEIKFLRRAHLTFASIKELLAEFKKDMEEQL